MIDKKFVQKIRIDDIEKSISSIEDPYRPANQITPILSKYSNIEIKVTE